MSHRALQKLEVSAYTIPTESPEADGTIDWSSTTLVLVELTSADSTGLGYTYADPTAARLIESKLFPQIRDLDPFDIPRAHAEMVRSVRNLGRPGIAAMAISAVDNALWDLKARLLELSLIDLLGAVRESAEVYGSGGFTSYSLERLHQQMEGWAREGFTKVKMKIGRDARADLQRVQLVREAVGPEVQIFVDANGGYSRKEALAQAERFSEDRVTWFEEPVSADDLEGLRLLRDRAPAPIQIAAGEYGYDPSYFHRLMAAGSVDVLQADATRCGGISGFLAVGAQAQARQLPFSFHCAPALHVAPACCSPNHVVGEYFFDHVRIENLLFEGTPRPIRGMLTPDRSRPGFGLEFKRADAQAYAL